MGVLGALSVPTRVFARDASQASISIVRWDIIHADFAKMTSAAGGHASASAMDGSIITLTGSGTFQPWQPDAVKGGGTWTATGSVAGSGTYKVTGLVSFVPAPGSPGPLTDLIGNAANASAGLAVLLVAYSNGMHGVLTVSCQIPGNPKATPPTQGAPKSIFEGIRTTMGYVAFWNGKDPMPGVDGNRTIFHITTG
jgi:hypothetical protein